jgi:carbon storage regulator
MLILSRRIGDSILIGDGIRIVVLDSDRRGVRIGIEAPADVSIIRGELADQLAEENQRASEGANEKEWLRKVPVKKK